MQRLGAAEDGAQRLERGPNDVVQRLLRGQRHPAGLGMEPQRLRARILRVKAVAHDAGPHPARRTELGHLFEEVHVAREKEGDPRSEVVDRQAGRLRRLDIGDGVAQRERDLLRRRRSRLAHVVSRDGDGVPVRQSPRAISEQVGDQAHRRLGGKDVRAAGGVLLEDVVLDGACDLLGRASLLLGDELIQEQQHGRRGVDGHRGRDPVKRDFLEQDLHVLQGVDRDPDLANLAVGHRVVGVVADLGRQVEGHGEPRLALLEQESIAIVGFGGRAEAGVLAHRPGAATIHVLVDATRERERAGQRLVRTLAPVLHRVDRLQREATVVLDLFHVSTNSVSTPPTLFGWTKAIRVPCSAA